MDNKRAVEVFKAFCDENRIIILQHLVNGEMCACMLLEELKITQPTLSHHMKILCDSGIVDSRKDGKWMHYSISKEGMSEANAYLESFTRVNPGRQKNELCYKCIADLK